MMELVRVSVVVRMNLCMVIIFVFRLFFVLVLVYGLLYCWMYEIGDIFVEVVDFLY